MRPVDLLFFPVAIAVAVAAAPAAAVAAPKRHAPHVARHRVLLSAIVPGPNPFATTVPALGFPVLPSGWIHQVAVASVWTARSSTLEQQILAEINAVRHAQGLGGVRFSTQLAAAAGAHARSLAVAGEFRHEWPDGTPFGRWIRRYYPIGGAQVWSVGENLLWTTGVLDAKQAVATWLASPPHREVLFLPDWRQLGIGVVAVQRAPGEFGGQDVVIASADFGRRT